MIHAHVLEDAGDRQRMGYIGFAAASELPVMGLLAGPG